MTVLSVLIAASYMMPAGTGSLDFWGLWGQQRQTADFDPVYSVSAWCCMNNDCIHYNIICDGTIDCSGDICAQLGKQPCVVIDGQFSCEQQPNRCCIDGQCQELDSETCLENGGDVFLDNAACRQYCGMGGCCEDGQCSQTRAHNCNGTWFDTMDACEEECETTGSCCLPEGCRDMKQTACQHAGGTYYDDASSCMQECEVHCCTDSQYDPSCSKMTEAACADAGGDNYGSQGTCEFNCDNNFCCEQTGCRAVPASDPPACPVLYGTLDECINDCNHYCCDEGECSPEYAGGSTSCETTYDDLGACEQECPETWCCDENSGDCYENDSETCLAGPAYDSKASCEEVCGGDPPPPDHDYCDLDILNCPEQLCAGESHTLVAHFYTTEITTAQSPVWLVTKGQHLVAGPLSGAGTQFTVDLKSADQIDATKGLEVEVVVTYTSGQIHCEDLCSFRVVILDVDIDSDNSGDIGGSEDAIEEAPPGKYIMRNVDHDKDSNVWDLDNSPPLPSDDELAHLKLEVKPGDAIGSWRLVYPASLRVYDANMAIIPNMAWQALPIPPAAANSRVEGIINSIVAGDQSIELEVDLDGDGGPDCSDRVVSTVLEVDIDVDSDNNNTNDSGDHLSPDRNKEEDSSEASTDPDFLGKVFSVNTDDDEPSEFENFTWDTTDEGGDAVPDMYDGFNASDENPDDDHNPDENDFVPFGLKFSPAVNLGQAKIQFIYQAANPSAVQYNAETGKYTESPFMGKARLWKIDGSQIRDKKKVTEGGDYIQQGTMFNVLQLTGSYDNQFFIEAIRAIHSLGSSPNDEIEVRVDPDGPGPAGTILHDKVKITAIKLPYEGQWRSDINAGSGVYYYLLNQVNSIRNPAAIPTDGVTSVFHLFDYSDLSPQTAGLDQISPDALSLEGEDNPKLRWNVVDGGVHATMDENLGTAFEVRGVSAGIASFRPEFKLPNGNWARLTNPNISATIVEPKSLTVRINVLKVADDSPVSPGLMPRYSPPGGGSNIDSAAKVQQITDIVDMYFRQIGLKIEFEQNQTVPPSGAVEALTNGIFVVTPDASLYDGEIEADPGLFGSGVTMPDEWEDIVELNPAIDSLTVSVFICDTFSSGGNKLGGLTAGPPNDTNPAYSWPSVNDIKDPHSESPVAVFVGSNWDSPLVIGETLAHELLHIVKLGHPNALDSETIKSDGRNLMHAAGPDLPEATRAPDVTARQGEFSRKSDYVK